MSFADDDRPIKRPVSHEIGSDLSSLSVEDLEHRIALLQSEVARLQADKKRKAAGRRAADSFFR
ncbi:uncharacterized small protein (DUF1192 family) [Pseudorhizobium tarimense]|uniref:Uncharacterized small protein (DUF1192 family) n=1 Tax=Pseudorhizobium tarimense TaxID=1079109 RepID=A0ABV2H7R8_9HYPH|nr:DUF1192 domain-containing protein [Pseudorhizobium tarimense]MCJ8519572.1 DUF1192 domain-containing protein [Pseudorhizobium tarimense]